MAAAEIPFHPGTNRRPYMAAAETDTIPFHPGINRLLSMINRIVDTKREKQVFLHDLISNSSNALDKMRLERLTVKRKRKLDKMRLERLTGESKLDKMQLERLTVKRKRKLDKMRLERLTGESKLDGEPLLIRIVPDKAAKTLTIIDNGIGMTKSDLVKLGTIARPGTKMLMALLLCDASVHHFLWQLSGLGFYAAYFVAERVVVTTKRNGGEQYVWESHAGAGSFSVTRDTTGENLGRGTKVTLYLKDDQCVYLDKTLLKDLVKKHSTFISYQISLKTTEKDPSGSELSIIHEKPIWTRKPEDISKEEYAAYYKSLMKGVGEVSLGVKHFSHTACFLKEKKMKGVCVEFKAILFVPRGKSGCDPVDLVNVGLYQELIPEYLSFVRGIVDSEDVPLQISREMLQRNKIHEVIRKNLVNKCFELFFEIAENEEDYGKFYEAFSKDLKLGIRQDSQNRTKIAELLRYHSTESGDELTSLKGYVSRMKEGQSGIYYITRESKTTVENSPVLKDLKKQGYEVLFMVDAGDKDVVGQLKEFEGKKLEEVKLLIGPVDFKSTLTEEEKKKYEEWLKAGPEIMMKYEDWLKGGPGIMTTCCVHWFPPSPRMNPSDDDYPPTHDDCYDELKPKCADEHDASSQTTRLENFEECGQSSTCSLTRTYIPYLTSLCP